MNLCESIASIFSTCGKKKYGSILLDDHGFVIGMGYNGAPRGHLHCQDGGCPRFIDQSPSGSNYDNCVAIHAEANALLHSDHSMHASIIYVNGPPCFGCAKLIANSTVGTLVCKTDKSYTQWPYVKEFLEKSNITILELQDASI